MYGFRFIYMYIKGKPQKKSSNNGRAIKRGGDKGRAIKGPLPPTLPLNGPAIKRRTFFRGFPKQSLLETVQVLKL